MSSPLELRQADREGSLRRGFSLIELIASLTLLGVIGVMASLALVPVLQTYQLREQTTRQTQRSQLTMNRLIKELTWADPATITLGSGIVSWSSAHPGRNAATTHSAQLVGQQLRLDGHLLLEPVESFQAVAVAGTTMIDLTLTTSRGALATRVMPQPAPTAVP